MNKNQQRYAGRIATTLELGLKLVAMEKQFGNGFYLLLPNMKWALNSEAYVIISPSF